jgi:prolyl 4-hydroxylase
MLAVDSQARALPAVLLDSHFEPTGHSLRHAGMEFASDIEAQYKKSAEDGRSGHEHDQDGLPPYIIPGTPEEKHYRELHPNGYKAITGRNPSFGTGSTPAHFAAQQGHLEDLKLHLHNDADVIHKKDENGWTPLHEAVRGGHIEVIRFLIDQGANVNARTGAKSDGGSVLWWAKNTHEEDSEIVHYLMDIGALEAGPEL